MIVTFKTSKKVVVRSLGDRLSLDLVEYPLGYIRFPVDELRRDFPDCWIFDRQTSVMPSVELKPKYEPLTNDLIVRINEWLAK